MPFNLGFGEVLIILVVVLLLFGAKRIPEIAGSMGKGIREFKKSMTDVERAISDPTRDARLDAGDRDRLGRSDVSESREPVARDEDRPEPKRLLS
ncbi:MAG TPA: twin-arginine translocase TatA/TatE family subunit [Gemmatimonadaceae bacterium]|nr:twin-arginine translocase TatA/TatE family subunit [Gemmatimonadaceae bacterium]